MTATLSSPANLKPNPAWASLPLFDRTGWKRMAFGEFAESIGERAEPKDAQEEIYVGLEHLDPQCLHIRRWGKGSDVIGGKLRFRKGDIIFGKRRAYQRKLAVAEFGGICSAHAMVIRARPDKVLPEFLPFLMMSDRFMNRAVEISVGSLSPTINWTTLKLETFDLPPLDQQRRIAEILWAVDEATQGKIQLLAAIQNLLSQVQTAHFEKSDHNARLSNAVVASAYGPRFSNSLYSDVGSVAQLRTTDIDDQGKIDYSTIPRANLTVREMHSHILEDGDFLISRSGTCGIGAVYRESGIPTIPGAFLIRLRLDKTLLADYLREYINSSVGRKHMDRLAAGGVQKNIRGSSLLSEQVPMPPVKEQARFLADVNEKRACFAECSAAIEAERQLLSSLLNSLFSS